MSTDVVNVDQSTPLPDLKALQEAHKKALAQAKELRRSIRPEDRHKKSNVIKLQKMAKELMAEYQVTALMAIWELATMPEAIWAKNSALAQIKLLAAKMLAPQTEGSPEGSSLGETLRQLDQDFHASAPRIKSVRERIVTFEQPNVIEAAPPG